jgi:hypothetical protein
MATPPPPPTPPSPPNGDGTPDGGNPSHNTPPEVAPKPGRQSARAAGGAKKPTAPRSRGKKTQTSGGTAAKQAPKSPGASAAPSKPAIPRTPPRPVSRPRTRPGGLAASGPAKHAVDSRSTETGEQKRGGWWKMLAGGIGALAAGAALFSLRGSSRRKKAHQADGTDSSKSFKAGIADEGTIPE